MGDGEAAGDGVGLGVGEALGDDELAMVEAVVFPPQELSVRARASVNEQVWIVRQAFIISLREQKAVVLIGVEGQCNLCSNILDYGETLRLGD